MSFIIAAPSSGAGKTTLTLGILRALHREGVQVRAAKSGPDYIDPHFHAAACKHECMNLDAWAMSPDRIHALAAGNGPLIIEGAMGLFDGAPPDGRGATADLARLLDLPVVLVIDAARMAGSVAPIAAGFAGFDRGVHVAGVILNNVGSERHETMLRTALGRIDMPVFGALHRNAGIHQPARHLGLVQAQEHPDLESFLNHAADLVTASVDLAALLALPSPAFAPATITPTAPAQRIAVARDQAFAFAYPHLLSEWRDAGAEIAFFSPLANDPAPVADLIFLPGGYPELHAPQLAANDTFMKSLRIAAQTTDIYGECGGYMVLGHSLTDADGQTHFMAGLLPLEASFATRKLHLGYRDLLAEHGPFPGHWAGHEFHYATTIRSDGPSLFAAKDAAGTQLPAMGLRKNRVCGSFAHLIDRH